MGFNHRLQAHEPIEVAGGQVRIVDSSNFPISRTVAAALVELLRFLEVLRRPRPSNLSLRAS
jgi:hypothetical protein